MKFSNRHGIEAVVCDQIEAKRCYNLSLRKGEVSEKRKFEESGKVERQKQKHEIRSKLGEFKAFMIAFLRGNVDLFAWDPSNFKGINPEFNKRRGHSGAEKNCIIEEEVNKLLRAGYVSEVHYTDWLANVMMVPKVSGKWRMCTDFTDLNKAYPKDPYPLPKIDLLVDSTAGYEIFSMMDAYQGYHQIFMATEDRENIFCNRSRLVNKMFAKQIGKTMKVYADDMLVKSQKLEEHLTHLDAFVTMKRYGMKLNSSKCTFGVGGGKFLGYMVSDRGIEASPENIDAILKLKSPTFVKEVQKLIGRIASLNRFISRSADLNLHFFKILRKSKGFEWTDECEQAFKELKDHLKSPPLLVNPKEGDTLYLYLAVSARY
ncbi:UNVERIFIED_CONTAM: hypothetical protein Sindi_1314200 [Sesamum indicum]